MVLVLLSSTMPTSAGHSASLLTPNAISPLSPKTPLTSTNSPGYPFFAILSPLFPDDSTPSSPKSPSSPYAATSLSPRVLSPGNIPPVTPPPWLLNPQSPSSASPTCSNMRPVLPVRTAYSNSAREVPTLSKVTPYRTAYSNARSSSMSNISINRTSISTSQAYPSPARLSRPPVAKRNPRLEAAKGRLQIPSPMKRSFTAPAPSPLNVSMVMSPEMSPASVKTTVQILIPKSPFLAELEGEGRVDSPTIPTFQIRPPSLDAPFELDATETVKVKPAMPRLRRLKTDDEIALEEARRISTAMNGIELTFSPVLDFERSDDAPILSYFDRPSSRACKEINSEIESMEVPLTIESIESHNFLNRPLPPLPKTADAFSSTLPLYASPSTPTSVKAELRAEALAEAGRRQAAWKRSSCAPRPLHVRSFSSSEASEVPRMPSPRYPKERAASLAILPTRFGKGSLKTSSPLARLANVVRI